jgi:hypothetical protein
VTCHKLLFACHRRNISKVPEKPSKIIKNGVKVAFKILFYN